MVLIGGDKNDLGLVDKFADALGQQYAVQGRDIDIQEDHIHVMPLQIAQHVQTVLEGGFNGQAAVFTDEVSQLLLR
jgi:hypothetical protein